MNNPRLPDKPQTPTTVGSGAWLGDLDELAKKTMLQVRRNCLPQVDALLAAGWRYELPEIVNRKDDEPPSTLDSEPWQWYWRRPARRKNSPGMKFWSTQMAYNALMRESPNADLRQGVGSQASQPKEISK